MKDQQVYDKLLGKLVDGWNELPDKPDETPESTLHALWRLASGISFHPVKEACKPMPMLTKEAEAKLISLVNDRLSGVPLAYLTGRQVFIGIEFMASPKAMIPRKETEILGRLAIETAKQLVKERGTIRVVDLCTGSGNLALALAFYEPHCQVLGIDISIQAVELARENAVYLNLSDRVHFYQGDLVAPLEKENLFGEIDLITCNPPYTSSARVDRMPDEIINHEPRVAFDGGPFGVKIITRLIREAPRFIKPGSFVCLEVGAGQGEPVEKMIKRNSAYILVEKYQDKKGEIRALRAKTASNS